MKLPLLFLTLFFLGAAPGSPAAELTAPAAAAAPVAPAGVLRTVPPDPRGPGFVLVTPRFSTDTVLLDGRGQEAHVWPGNCMAAGGARLQPDGSLVRLGKAPLPPPFNQCGVEGGRLQHVSWDGKLLWDFVDATSDHMACGDIVKLPNGNILAPVLEFKSRAECEARGRESSRITDKGMLIPGLREFTPKGKAAGIPVWTWSLWDHLYQSRDAGLPHYLPPGGKPGMVDIGSLAAGKGPVWIMPMELDYHPQEDLVVMVVAGLGEAWVIDHGTTVSESSSHEGGRQGRGGRLLLRWFGNSSIPDPGSAPVSRLISARWNPAVAGNELALTVMKYEGRPFLPVVETVTLAKESMAPAGPVKVHLRGKRAGDDKVPLPSAADALPGVNLVAYAEGMQGRVHLMQRSQQPVWSHENKRGLIKVRPRVAMNPGEECCGQATPLRSTSPAVTAKPLAEISVAPVIRARLYAPDYLQF